MAAFSALQNALTSEPIMAFLRADRQYTLITDAATGTADTPGGLGAILTQKDKYDNYYAISYASRQLKDHEKNYSPFLLESAAAVWGMDVFNEYLKGKQFTLFTDHKPLEKMGHLHTKTMNRLQAALLEHDFVTSTRKEKLCLSITYPGYHLHETKQLMKLQKVLIPFNQISTICKRPMNSCKT
jgi:RNase H-like domain found in reverse transcriptase